MLCALNGYLTMSRTLPSLALFVFFASTALAQVTVEAPEPRAGEPLKIVVSGAWRDSCVPVVDDVFVPYQGRIIITYRISGSVCMQAMTDFTRPPRSAAASRRDRGWSTSG